jgi:hypothetical protein
MKPRDRPTAGWRTDLRSARFIPAKFEKPSTGAPTSPNRQPGGRSGDRAAACGLDSALARRTKLTLEAGQRHRLDRYLLKLAPLEGFHISGREFEPFAVCALPSEATMPVGLDSGWIIRSYCVNKFDLLRQSDTDLPHSFFDIFPYQSLSINSVSRWNASRPGGLPPFMAAKRRISDRIFSFIAR